jgi:hypothetical protein
MKSDHSHPSCADFNNNWSHTFSPLIRLHGVYMNNCTVVPSKGQHSREVRVEDFSSIFSAKSCFRQNI